MRSPQRAVIVAQKAPKFYVSTRPDIRTFRPVPKGQLEEGLDERRSVDEV